MSDELHSPGSGVEIASHDPFASSLERQSAIALEIIHAAEPEGIGIDEFKRLTEEKGIEESELNEVLRPLIHYAKIYFNAKTGKYHYLWSSPLQWE